ncbi:hypothetical protein BDZ88DRAFT_477918 [Geranomyces variabilis]|nr:hypothetical protein BDZ88DRAFT_477918 [Geranomyces variabilis]
MMSWLPYRCARLEHKAGALNGAAKEQSRPERAGGSASRGRKGAGRKTARFINLHGEPQLDPSQGIGLRAVLVLCWESSAISLAAFPAGRLRSSDRSQNRNARRRPCKNRHVCAAASSVSSPGGANHIDQVRFWRPVLGVFCGLYDEKKQPPPLSRAGELGRRRGRIAAGVLAAQFRRCAKSSTGPAANGSSVADWFPSVAIAARTARETGGRGSGSATAVVLDGTLANSCRGGGAKLCGGGKHANVTMRCKRRGVKAREMITWQRAAAATFQHDERRVAYLAVIEQAMFAASQGARPLPRKRRAHACKREIYSGGT